MHSSLAHSNTDPKDTSTKHSVLSTMTIFAAVSTFFSHISLSSTQLPTIFQKSQHHQHQQQHQQQQHQQHTLGDSANDSSFWLSLSCCGRMHRKHSRHEYDEASLASDDFSDWHENHELQLHEPSVLNIALQHQQIPPALGQAFYQVRENLQQGNKPKALQDGMGGVYCLFGAGDKPAAIFKPLDEEIGCQANPKGYGQSEGARDGISPGECAFREVAAFVLDYNSCGVPATTLATYISDSGVKLGSLQCFVEAVCTAEDMGCSKFEVFNVQAIALMDIRLLNLDRHEGNLLVTKRGDLNHLVPIDHGCCLPERLKVSNFEWCWISWPQVKQPIHPTLLSHIHSLDPTQDAQLLSRIGLPISKRSLLVLRLTTRVLKVAANANKSLFDVAVFVSRGDDDLPSEMERVVARCRWFAAFKVVGGKGGDFEKVLEEMVVLCAAKRFAQI